MKSYPALILILLALSSNASAGAEVVLLTNSIDYHVSYPIFDFFARENITVKYIGKVDPTLLVYNYIARPPYFWSEKLFLTVCNVKSGSIIEINASTLEGGMFGTALKLKLYDSRQKLIDETTIPTTYSCIDHLEIGDVYGKYEVLGFGEVEGISYQHYSYYALKVEDAMDYQADVLNARSEDFPFLPARLPDVF